jgi:hypothetical protein
MVPLRSSPLSVGPAQMLSDVTFRMKIMAGAKAVHRHLDDLVDAGTPASERKENYGRRRDQASVQAFVGR